MRSPNVLSSNAEPGSQLQDKWRGKTRKPCPAISSLLLALMFLAATAASTFAAELSTPSRHSPIQASINAAPTVTNAIARQRTDSTGIVDITYSLADPDSATVYVSVEISTDGGSSYNARSYVTGDVGWVRPGGPRRICWDAKASLGLSAVFPSCKAKITADDSSGGVYPGEMIYIPAGSFLMGNSGNEPNIYDRELPQHSVYLPGYWIGKYEVTRGEYAQFMNAGGYSTPSYWSSDGWIWKTSYGISAPLYWPAEVCWYYPCPFTQTDSHPVVGVSYYEAEAFCNWAGGHLPTEAQWEKAARPT